MNIPSNAERHAGDCDPFGFHVSSFNNDRDDCLGIGTAASSTRFVAVNEKCLHLNPPG
jgi:hypothetical protein